MGNGRFPLDRGGSPLPTNSQPGDTFKHIDPSSLKPNAHKQNGLEKGRYEKQRELKYSSHPHKNIKVTIDGVIIDGHHRARVNLDDNHSVSVDIVDDKAKPLGISLGDMDIGPDRKIPSQAFPWAGMSTEDLKKLMKGDD